MTFPADSFAEMSRMKGTEICRDSAKERGGQGQPEPYGGRRNELLPSTHCQQDNLVGLVSSKMPDGPTSQTSCGCFHLENLSQEFVFGRMNHLHYISTQCVPIFLQEICMMETKSACNLCSLLTLAPLRLAKIHFIYNNLQISLK